MCVVCVCCECYIPNHACCSPCTSIASPKSASFTAAFLHLLASSRFSGCTRTVTSAKLSLYKSHFLKTSSQHLLNLGCSRRKQQDKEESLFSEIKGCQRIAVICNSSHTGARKSDWRRHNVVLLCFFQSFVYILCSCFIVCVVILGLCGFLASYVVLYLVSGRFSVECSCWFELFQTSVWLFFCRRLIDFQQPCVTSLVGSALPFSHEKSRIESVTNHSDATN